MVEFNREHFDALILDEDRAAYLTECFGEDQAAKEAATYLVNNSKGKIMSMGGMGNGKYAYCIKCNTRVSAIIKEDGKSYCATCKFEVVWRDRKEENSNQKI